MLDTIASLIADPRLSLLLGVAVRSLVVPILGALILILMGRRASASARYLVMLVCMLGLLVALPLLSWVMPVWRVRVLPASVAPIVTTVGRPVAANPASAMLGKSSAVSHTPLLARQGVLAPLRVSAKSGGAPVGPISLSPARVLTLLWLGGVALYGSWLILGRLRLWRLAQRCPVVVGGPLTTLVGELAARCDVRAPLVVRQAAREDGAFVTPMTWGCRRPVLLLPASVLEEWPAERLRAVLLHELAHIARLDWLTQIVAQLACALYWFNPLVWKMAGAMEREAEQACDDRVLLAGVEASDYACHLLEVVKSLRTLHAAILQGGAQTMAAPRHPRAGPQPGAVHAPRRAVGPGPERPGVGASGGPPPGSGQRLGATQGCNGPGRRQSGHTGHGVELARRLGEGGNGCRCGAERFGRLREHARQRLLDQV